MGFLRLSANIPPCAAGRTLGLMRPVRGHNNQILPAPLIQSGSILGQQNDFL